MAPHAELPHSSQTRSAHNSASRLLRRCVVDTPSTSVRVGREIAIGTRRDMGWPTADGNKTVVRLGENFVLVSHLAIY